MVKLKKRQQGSKWRNRNPGWLFGDARFYREGVVWDRTTRKKHAEYLKKESEMRKNGLTNTPEYEKILTLLEFYNKNRRYAKYQRQTNRIHRGGALQELLSGGLFRLRKSTVGQLIRLRTAVP